MTHRFDWFWSRVRSTCPRENSTVPPSGEMVGLEMDSIWKYVALSRYFGCWAAGIATAAVSARASEANVTRRRMGILLGNVDVRESVSQGEGRRITFTAFRPTSRIIEPRDASIRVLMSVTFSRSTFTPPC